MVNRELSRLVLMCLLITACEGFELTSKSTTEYCYSTKEQFPYQTYSKCEWGDIKITEDVYARHMQEHVTKKAEFKEEELASDPTFSKDVHEQYMNGLKYEKGRGVTRSYSEAIKWYTLAAKRGHPEAQYDLGLFYEIGKGVKEDRENAVRWYDMAANQGHDIAAQALERLSKSKTSYKRPLPGLSDVFVCGTAMTADYNWKSSGADLVEVKRRGFSLEDCRKIVGAQPKTPLLHGLASVAMPLKPTVSQPKNRDIFPPSIQIATSITVKQDNPTISGKVTDTNKVVQVTVNGTSTKHSGNTFSFTRYVPASGTTVKIEAIDEWGNKSSQTVKLVRAINDTSDQITFASLDPTKLNGQANKNAVALIIGVADYTRAPAAVYADSDASVFSDYARRALGIPQSSIKVLTNAAASNTDIKVSIKQWLRGRIEEGKTDVYVFYAGHGLASANGEDLYLLPHDGVPSLLEDTSLQRNELFDVIAAANPKSATVFLDTCYSGLSRGEETLLASARPILITPKGQTVPEGFTVFSAASGLQISSGLDEAKHGLFSYYLMKGLEGGADANADRAITAGELHAYVLKNVKRQAVRLGREQEPELSGDLDRVLVRW